MPSFRPDALTWTGLLAQWMNFAQAALAVPEAAQGSRWRESVAPLITLQAVTFALADLERLARDERPLALDKAEMLIENATEHLRSIWDGQPLPESVREICEDARLAHAAARQTIADHGPN